MVIMSGAVPGGPPPAARRVADAVPEEGSVRGVAVDVALVLAIDVSGSISEDRMRLQIEGYAKALQHPDFLQAVSGGHQGRIALTFVEWSEARRQSQAVGWRIISRAEDRERFIKDLMQAEKPMPGWTSISAAIDYCVRILHDSGLVTGRKVIDVSSDGVNNDGRSVTAARDDAVAAGVTINGLPIVEIDPALDAYYRANVIGGADSFVIVARDMENFAEAILRKLLVEVAAGPHGLVRQAGVRLR